MTRDERSLSQMASHVSRQARSIEPWIVEIRRELHRFPELLFDLPRTSAKVQQTLEELNIPFQNGIADSGVVATLGTGESPCVALRADMDALPIHEEADVPFRSEIDGRMHACGHDCHTAMLLGAARLLREMESELRGTVKLIFQPAEEGGGGAKRMFDARVLEAPQVERIFGIHVWPLSPSGTVASRAGAFLAAVNQFKITVEGVGGHGALPHHCVDPVLTAAKIIQESQSIVSREVDPLDSAVISFCSIHGGHAFNVIPPQVEIVGTIRALSMERLQFLKTRLAEIAGGVALANRCQVTIENSEIDYPATINDAEVWQHVQDLARPLVEEHGILESPPIMGGEDFAFFSEQVPGCFVGLGTYNEAEGCTHSVHHPKFKFDESVLHLGTSLHVMFALTHLN